MPGSYDDIMGRAFELSRERSQSVLTESGTDLGRFIAEGQVEFGVDRTVYSLLGRLDPGKVHTDFGVDLKTAIGVTRTAALAEYAALLVYFVAAFFVFHWWGLGVIVIAFVLYQWGVSSNVTGSGGISLFVGVGGAIAALQSRSISEAIWGISWAAVGFSQWVRYQVPVRAVKRAALRSRSFMEFLISRDAAVLRRRE